MNELLWFATTLAFFAALGLMTASAWRTKLAWLMAQYLAAFLFIGYSWPWSTASARLLTGWMAAILLAIGLLNYGDAAFDTPQAGFQRAFGGLATVFVSGFLLAISFMQPDLLPVNQPLLLAGSLLIAGNALLRLGLRESLSDNLFSLLSLLSGFEVLYAAIETSLLVNLLLSAVTLGLALLGSFLLARQGEGEA